MATQGADNRWRITQWLGGTIANVMDDTMQRASGLVEPFQEVVDQSATTVHPIFLPLRQSLAILCETLKKEQKVSERDLGRILQLLNPLIDHDPRGYFKNPEDRVVGEQLSILAQLRPKVSDRSLVLAEAMQLLNAINLLYHNELGKIGTVLDNFFQVIAAEGRTTFGRLFASSSSEGGEVSGESQALLDKFFSQPHASRLPRVAVSERLLLQQANLFIESSVNASLATVLFGDDGMALTTQEKIFGKIDQTYPYAPGRVYAKLKYYLMLPVVRFYLQGTINNLVNHAIDTIEEGEKDHFQSLSRACLQFLHAQFATINGAYGYIASHREEASGTIGAMMEGRLQVPLLNRGRTTDKINRAFSDTFIDRFIPRFGWSQTTSQILEKIRFEEGSRYQYLNYLVVPLTTFLAVAQRAIFFPFEFLLNFGVTRSFKLIVAKTGVVENLRNKSREALLGQNYAHTVNVLIRDALAEALDQMSLSKKGATEKKQSLATSTLNELDGLFTNFLRTLQLHKERDLGNLQSLIKDGTLLDRLTQGLSELTGRTVNPTRAIVEGIGEELSAVAPTLLNKTQFYHFLYTTLQSLNGIFDHPQAVSEKDKMEVEAEMINLLSTIITKAVREALHEQLAPKASVVDPFVVELQRLTREFTDAINDQTPKETILRLHDSSREALRDLLTRAKGAHSQSRTDIAALEELIAKRAKIQMAIVEAAKASRVEAIRQQLEELRKPLQGEHPSREANGLDLRGWENDIFQMVRGFLVSRAGEIPSLIKEPFLLRKMVNGLFLWFTTGKVEE
jgi:hypothetical protein